jgi:tRNA (adenine57-N1/adenine58-N1)-methyltransferase
MTIEKIYRACHKKSNNRKRRRICRNKLQDVTKGIKEKDLDAIILDIPTPWDAVKHAYKALKPGGYLCTYSPLTSQVENTVREIKKQKFIEVKTIEKIKIG